MSNHRISCFSCGKEFSAGRLLNVCDCGKPLRVDYDLTSLKSSFTPSRLTGRPHDLWRYREVLPLPPDVDPPTLGEGGTPLLTADALASELGLKTARLLVKDEAVNPTGSFKARGMAVAVAMARHLGVKKLAVPSAGNAGGAMAAYAARAGLEAHVFMPRDVPMANRLECEIAGAHVTLVDGLITDCAKAVAERKEAEGWFDVSTLKEPYRVEGKKTMGYEIAEQLGWELPDVIFYPTGGGTGLVGMWKAFEEMEALGWIGSKRPRMVSVQASGCAPIVRAFKQGYNEAGTFENAHTVAAGLRVPRAIADFVMLDILRKSGGTAVSVDDAEMIADARALGKATGVCACPEGGACLHALRILTRSGWISSHETVVVFNTGTGTKYAEAFSAFPVD
jgi:threonine synthase